MGEGSVGGNGKSRGQADDMGDVWGCVVSTSESCS